MDHTVIKAYKREDKTAFVNISPAEDRRVWMDEDTSKWAYRCLPLRIANQSGFQIVLLEEVIGSWNGTGFSPEDVTLELGSQAASSHFPGAILTFDIPFILVTPPAVNLLVLPPTNSFVDGAQALTGMVETDWLHFTFTINYKFTRPGKVRFVPGTPIATLLPYPRDWLGAFSLETQSLGNAPESIRQDYAAYSAARKTARVNEFEKGQQETLMLWYYRGIDARGQTVEGHTKSVPRCPFRESDLSPSDS